MSRPFCGCAGHDWEGYPICDGRCEITEENLGSCIAERFGLEPLQGEAICKTALRAHQIAAEHLGARPAWEQKVLGEVSGRAQGEPEGCWGCPERARLDGLIAAGADTLRAESERLREAEAEVNRLRFANAALEDANAKLRVGLTRVCQDADDQIDRLLRERNGLQDMLAQARREAEDLRHRVEWGDLED